VSCTPYSCNFN